MIIPVHRAQVDEPKGKRLLRPNSPARPIGLARRKQRFLQLKRTAANSTRCLYILVGLLALRWHMLASITLPLVLLGVLLGGSVIALGYSLGLSGWPELLLDSIAVALLIQGTGGAGSPLLGLTLVLILLGGLLGGSHGALAGSAAASTIILIVNLMMRHPINAITVDLTFLYLACGCGSAWFWQRASELLSNSFDDLDQLKQDRAAAAAGSAGRWQQLSLHIAACASLQELAQLTTYQATTIARCPARVELPESTESPAPRNGATICIPIAVDGIRGTILLGKPAAELSPAQHEALEQLAALVAFRAAALHNAAWQKRQETALAALWEISGLLHLDRTRDESISDDLSRIATALDLHWLALLVPNHLQTLAPMMIVRGRPTAIAPVLSGAHLRMAAEALRSERPLVGSEGKDELACLPICILGHAPLVLLARGSVADAATQALLMLFGNLLADRLAADSARSYNPNYLYQAAIA